jgi:hypothetical protein
MRAPDFEQIAKGAITLPAVVVRRLNVFDPVRHEGTPYGNLSTAFSMVWGLLMIQRDNGLESAEVTGI